MVANILPKPLKGDLFRRMRNWLLNVENIFHRVMPPKRSLIVNVHKVWVCWDNGDPFKINLEDGADVDDLKTAIKQRLTPRLNDVSIDEIFITDKNGSKLNSNTVVDMPTTAANALHASRIPTSLSEEIKRLNQEIGTRDREIQLRDREIQLRDGEIQLRDREIQLRDREIQLNQDRRLQVFSKNISGSNSRGSGGNRKTVAERESYISKLKAVKAKVRKIFNPLKCFFCNRTTDISVAHIVSSGRTDYPEFDKAAGYKCDLDVFSVRNYIPLCGKEGEHGTCHDSFDKFLVSLMYNPFKQKYFLHSSDEAPGKLKRIAEKNTKLKPPKNWTPYHRLLAWRARKGGIEYGYTTDRQDFEKMNALSEDCKSRNSENEATILR
eukprot:gene13380-28367_t